MKLSSDKLNLHDGRRGQGIRRFANHSSKRAILNELARQKGLVLPLQSQDLVIDQEYDKLAAWVRASLNMDLIYQMTGLEREYVTTGSAG